MFSCLIRRAGSFLIRSRYNGTRTLSNNVRAYEEIPTKKGFLSSLGLILNGGPSYLHEHCEKRHNELGSIYREKLGPTEMIFISDTKLIQTVVANEGRFPHHNVPEAWNYYNEVKGVERGLFFQVGHPWARLRSVLNKVLLADPKKINQFSADISQINLDLLKTWADKSSFLSKNGDLVIENVKSYLCNWSIEATGFMLFGARMGCINQNGSNQNDTKASNLVTNVAKMFEETSNFQILPVKLAHKLKLNTWKRFELATTSMLKIATEYANENIAKVKGPNRGPSLIQDLLSQKELSDEEVSRGVVDLIIAAADTTSNSLQWMLYLIAKHKEVQERILDEANSISSLENPLENAPYIRSFMKEVSRLYPTAPFLARTLDTNINLGGYFVPRGKPIVFSLYTTSRMEEYFEEPLKFKPERWLRRSPSDGEHSQEQCPSRRNHAFASLPFGIGKRMCIGKRAAELEMLLFIVSFVRFFESSLFEEDCRMNIKLKMILCPERPLRLKLRLRKEEEQI